MLGYMPVLLPVIQQLAGDFHEAGLVGWIFHRRIYRLCLADGVYDGH